MEKTSKHSDEIKWHDLDIDNAEELVKKLSKIKKISLKDFEEYEKAEKKRLEEASLYDDNW